MPVANESQLVVRVPKANVASKPWNENLKEKVWGQMLYVGAFDEWMAPEADRTLREDCNEESVFHLPFFFFTEDFTGDAYFEPEVPSYRKYRSSKRQAPLFSPPANPRVLFNGIAVGAPAATAILEPPHLHALPPFAHPLPVLSPSSLQPSSETSPRSPVFHVPTAEELITRLEEMDEMCKIRAPEADIDSRRKSRDAADGRIALPPSPPPRVFVPPNLSSPFASSSSSQAESGLSIPPTFPAGPRSLTFPHHPALAARFPLFFGRDADLEVGDADVSEGTFSDIDSITDGDSDAGGGYNDNEEASADPGDYAAIFSGPQQDDGEEADDEDEVFDSLESEHES
ncbi:hypothetical protein B0H13DRAFT_2524996 [Mycena leptocephala]|nr:hypothetical protein B0H13DRAFT_2524996 [Mycena leptocephala]